MNFPGWPSGNYKGLMVLNLSNEAIESKFDLSLFRGKDDLDCYFAGWTDSSFGLLSLMKYDNSPANGFVVYIDYQQNTKDAIAVLKSDYGISDEEITWVQCEI